MQIKTTSATGLKSHLRTDTRVELKRFVILKVWKGLFFKVRIGESLLQSCEE